MSTVMKQRCIPTASSPRFVSSTAYCEDEPFPPLLAHFLELSLGLETGLHFVFSNFALSGYNRGVLTKAKTKPIMTMDLRDGPIRCGLPAERSGRIRFQAMSAIRDCRPNRKGGVAG